MRILIAVDDTEGALVATRFAQALFPRGEHIVISAASVAPFMVTDPMGGGAFVGGPSVEAFEAVEEQADAAVESAHKVLTGEGSTSVETHVEIGSPGPVICDQAKDLHADVVVVGHRSQNWLSRLFDPSVSDYVVRHAPCPVLVVREQFS